MGLGLYFTPPRFHGNSNRESDLHMFFFSNYLYICILVGIQNGTFSCYLRIFKLILGGLGFPIWKNPSPKDSKIIPMYVCSTPYVLTERVHMGIFQKVRWTVHLTGHLGNLLLFAICFTPIGQFLEILVKPEQQNELQCILSFSGLCSLCPEGKNPLRFIYPVLVFSSFIDLYNTQLHDNLLGFTRQRLYMYHWVT